jgi:glycosyltransferase involved in cell wall biosynthesis
MTEQPRRICLVPHYRGVGGPSSFQRRLARGLAARAIEVSFDLSDRPYDAILVIGATRRLGGLWRARQAGIPIFQRLNGMNWLHRRRRTGWRHYVRAELANRLLAWTRDRFASGVIYQSQFARDWWEREHGPALASAHVVLNGVDLERFTPSGPEERPPDRARILMVEGRLAGGYELGLEHALALGETLSAHRQVELIIAGRVDQNLRARIEAQASFSIQWAGVLPAEDIPALDRSAHFLYSADIHPACPNAVVEALACGLPVLAFETGALPELVGPQSGRLVGYGGDAWRLDPPDFQALSMAALELLDHQDAFRRGARTRAETGLGLKTMTSAYLQVFGWV